MSRGRRTRTLLTRAALAALLVVCLGAPANAATKTRTLRCAITVPLRFTPGISATPQGSGFAGTGTAACQRQPGLPMVLTGSITLSGETSAADSCSTGAGSGVLTATLAGTDGGVSVLTARFTFLRDGLVVNGPLTATGDDSGLGVVAFALAPPLQQNCLSTPIRRATAVGALTLTGAIY